LLRPEKKAASVGGLFLADVAYWHETDIPYRRMSAFRGKAEVGVGQLDFRV